MRTDFGLERVISHVDVLTEIFTIEIAYLACRSKAELGLGAFDEDVWHDQMVVASMEAQGHGYDDFHALRDIVPPTYATISFLESAWEDGYSFADAYCRTVDAPDRIGSEERSSP